MRQNHSQAESKQKHKKVEIRPAFISKVEKKTLALQILTHLGKNDLNDIYQSGYKKCHSSEKALFGVQNDLLMVLDSGCSVILVMLDFVAAFSTIHHSHHSSCSCKRQIIILVLSTFRSPIRLRSWTNLVYPVYFSNWRYCSTS